METFHWDMAKCPSYKGVRLMVVRLVEVILQERHLRSAGACESVLLRKVSVLGGFTVPAFIYTLVNF